VRWSQVYNDKLSLKITAATTLRDLRDQVCEKRKLDKEAYGLEFNGKAMDLNLTAFGLNLQQGAKLDLVKVTHTDPGTFQLHPHLKLLPFAPSRPAGTWKRRGETSDLNPCSFRTLFVPRLLFFLSSLDSQRGAGHLGAGDRGKDGRERGGDPQSLGHA